MAALEKGVKAEKLGRLAVALNISADYLLFGTETTDLNSVFAALPDEMKQQVEKTITVFVDTVQISTNNILEKKKADDKQGDWLFSRFCYLQLIDESGSQDIFHTMHKTCNFSVRTWFFPFTMLYFQ